MSENFTRLAKNLSDEAEKAIAFLGYDLQIARKRRDMTQATMAERIGVSVETVKRMEQGDPGVRIGIIANALGVFGMAERLMVIANPSTDSKELKKDVYDI